MGTHRRISARLDAPASQVFEILQDLSTYPRWLDIVSRVEPAPADVHEHGGAWWVTLRARLGPLARSKRLRMVRTVATAPEVLRFERRETDGRTHSAWVLDASIDGDGDRCDVQVDLRYEGRFWTAPLEAVLGAQATDAVPRLQALLGSGGTR